MLVRATRLGYYGVKRRRPGAVFKIKGDKEFSETWMEKVEKQPAPAVVDDVIDEDEILDDEIIDEDEVI